MTDGPLHTGTGGGVALGHSGIKLLGHCVDHIGILYGHDNGFTQIAVPQNMSRNSQLMHGFSNQEGNVGVGPVEGWIGEWVGRFAAKAPICQKVWA